jgi:hypothetical protein
MSWHFLRGAGEASWVEKSLDGAPAALLKLMPTPDPSCSPGSEMDASTRFQSGMTSGHSTGDRGAGTSISSPGAFHARTSPAPEKERGSKGSAAGSGATWRELSVRFDRRSRSLKIRRCSGRAASKSFSRILPRWGMMRAGALWERTTSPLPTRGIGCGSWPTCHGFSKDGRSNGPSGNELGRAVNRSLFPTPRASQAGPDFAKLNRSKTGISLQTMVAIWPTPSALDHKGSGHSGQLRDRLDYAVERGATKSKRYPTPDVGMARGRGAASAAKRHRLGGSLNPPWVEWLMGWPLGWTDCGALGMGRFRRWLRSHGISCRPSATGATPISRRGRAPVA